MNEAFLFIAVICFGVICFAIVVSINQRRLKAMYEAAKGDLEDVLSISEETTNLLFKAEDRFEKFRVVLEDIKDTPRTYPEMFCAINRARMVLEKYPDDSD